MSDRAIPQEEDELVVSINNDNVIQSLFETYLGSYKDKIYLGLSIICAFMFCAAQGIIIPLLTLKFPSMFFISFWTSAEITFILFLIMLGFLWKDIRMFKLQDGWLLVISSGICCALMSIAKVYASDPNKTPPIMQSTLQSITIVFTVIFSKLLLDKQVSYDLKLIIPSVCLLLQAIFVPFAFKIAEELLDKKYAWILLYTFGIGMRGLYTVLQEKYFIQTNDGSLENKIKLLFYSNLIQLICVTSSFPLEYVVGNSEDPLRDFVVSLKMLGTDPNVSLLFHGFTLAYFIFLGFTIYLTTISSNYVMVISIFATPAVTCFFTIFKHWTPEIIGYPLYIIIPSLINCVLGGLLWIIGETKH